LVVKVLFIYTDIGISVGYSCGVGALSAYLRKKGHDTKLLHVSDELNYGLDVEKIVADVEEYDPGLICFSAVTNQWFYVKIIAKLIRRNCNIPIVVGGHHANAAPAEIIEEEAVDFVCKGEGERPLLELVEKLEAGENVHHVPNMLVKKRGYCNDTIEMKAESVTVEPVGVTDTSSSDGSSGESIKDTTTYQLSDGTEIVDNPVGRWVDDLDSLPFEDRDIFNYREIVDSRHGWAEVIATRGCPYTCAYCFNIPFFDMYKEDLRNTGDAVKMKDFIRRRGVESTIAMLKEIIEEYPNVKYFTFVDDVFAIYTPWLAELAPVYKKEIGLPFAATSQPLAFNERIARILQEMGCKVVKMGVEAGNPDLRNQVLNRGIPDRVLIDAFNIARKYNLKPQAFNMIGLPRETNDNMMETVRLNAKLRAYIVWVSTFMPYPGTNLYTYCRDQGLMDETKWDGVKSYRGGSVLNETSFSRLDLEKMRVMFRWHLNVALQNGCSETYAAAIAELDSLSEKVWMSGEAEELWLEREPMLDKQFREVQIDHYVGKKYVNMLWAEEYNYDLT